MTENKKYLSFWNCCFPLFIGLNTNKNWGHLYRLFENKNDTSVVCMHVLVTSGTHQNEVHFCLFWKLASNLHSKVRKFKHDSVVHFGKNSIIQTVQVHKTSSYQCRIYTTVTQCFLHNCYGKEIWRKQKFDTNLSRIICLWYWVMSETVKASKTTCAL